MKSKETDISGTAFYNPSQTGRRCGHSRVASLYAPPRLTTSPDVEGHINYVAGRAGTATQRVSSRTPYPRQKEATHQALTVVHVEAEPRSRHASHPTSQPPSGFTLSRPEGSRTFTASLAQPVHRPSSFCVSHSTVCGRNTI